MASDPAQTELVADNKIATATSGLYQKKKKKKKISKDFS